MFRASVKSKLSRNKRSVKQNRKASEAKNLPLKSHKPQREALPISVSKSLSTRQSSRNKYLHRAVSSPLSDSPLKRSTLSNCLESEDNKSRNSLSVSPIQTRKKDLSFEELLSIPLPSPAKHSSKSKSVPTKSSLSGEVPAKSAMRTESRSSPRPSSVSDFHLRWCFSLLFRRCRERKKKDRF